jgi:hypothetical protein
MIASTRPCFKLHGAPIEPCPLSFAPTWRPSCTAWYVSSSRGGGGAAAAAAASAADASARQTSATPASVLALCRGVAEFEAAIKQRFPDAPPPQHESDASGARSAKKELSSMSRALEPYMLSWLEEEEIRIHVAVAGALQAGLAVDDSFPSILASSTLLFDEYTTVLSTVVKVSRGSLLIYFLLFHSYTRIGSHQFTICACAWAQGAEQSRN